MVTRLPPRCVIMNYGRMAKLRAGDIIPGPAIIVEMDSTILIEADCTGTVDSVGNIFINLA
jgi:N-methylhydantoinase A